VILAQITDPHIKEDRKLAYGLVDTAAYLERTVEHLNAFAPEIQAVMVTGDLTDRGDPEEYAAIHPILSKLRMPFYVLPGNHDDRGNLVRAFCDHEYLSDVTEFVQYVLEEFPIRLIGLDSAVTGEPYGYLCPDRLAWLDHCLSEDPRKPAMLFLHHPPFETGIGHMDVQSLQNPDDLFDVLARHPQVRHVACGHVHRAIETCINGVALSTAPNAAHSVTLDLSPGGSSSFTMDPPAVRIFRIDGNCNVITHLSFIGRFDGPHPFYAADGSLVD